MQVHQQEVEIQSYYTAIMNHDQVSKRVLIKKKPEYYLVVLFSQWRLLVVHVLVQQLKLDGILNVEVSEDDGDGVARGELAGDSDHRGTSWHSWLFIPHDDLFYLVVALYYLDFFVDFCELCRRKIVTYNADLFDPIKNAKIAEQRESI